MYSTEFFPEIDLKRQSATDIIGDQTHFKEVYSSYIREIHYFQPSNYENTLGEKNQKNNKIVFIYKIIFSFVYFDCN